LEYRGHAIEGAVSLTEHFTGGFGDFVLRQDVPRNRSREGNQLCGLTQVGTSNAVWEQYPCTLTLF